MYRKPKTYFVQNGNPKIVKIGKALVVEKRVKALQTASPTPLKIIAIIEDYSETELHRRFKADRINPKSEWFRYSDQIKEFLAEPRRQQHRQIEKLVNKMEKWREQDKQRGLFCSARPRIERFLERSFGLAKLRKNKKVNDDWGKISQDTRNEIADYISSPTGQKHFIEWKTRARAAASTLITMHKFPSIPRGKEDS